MDNWPQAVPLDIDIPSVSSEFDTYGTIHSEKFRALAFDDVRQSRLTAQRFRGLLNTSVELDERRTVCSLNEVNSTRWRSSHPDLCPVSPRFGSCGTFYDTIRT